MIKVYPTSKASLSIKHPIDGALRVDGSEWIADGFTARMITDRAVTTDAAAGWRPSQPAAQPAPTKSSTTEIASKPAAEGKPQK